LHPRTPYTASNAEAATKPVSTRRQNPRPATRSPLSPPDSPPPARLADVFALSGCSPRFAHHQQCLLRWITASSPLESARAQTVAGVRTTGFAPAATTSTSRSAPPATCATATSPGPLITRLCRLHPTTRCRGGTCRRGRLRPCTSLGLLPRMAPTFIMGIPCHAMAFLSSPRALDIRMAMVGESRWGAPMGQCIWRRHPRILVVLWLVQVECTASACPWIDMAWAHPLVLGQWAQGLVPILTKAHRRNLLGAGRDNDWKCPNCNNINFAFRTVCNMRKCNTPRPDTQGSKPDSSRAPKPKTPEGSWKCEKCNNINYPFRTKCNRPSCGEEKPLQANSPDNLATDQDNQ
uniref:RanBP2-type domain-containing protein n=1 Tax=Aegilops tauschii subsp. strangulata TaxID=200361 RepID=A0A453RL84_AEGTS